MCGNIGNIHWAATPSKDTQVVWETVLTLARMHCMQRHCKGDMAEVWSSIVGKGPLNGFSE